MSSKNLKLKLTIDADGNITGVLPKVNDQLGEVGKGAQNAGEKTDGMTNSLKKLRNEAIAAFSTYKLIQYTKASIDQADAYKAMQGQIVLVTESQQDQLKVQNQLHAISSETRGDLSSMAKLYSAMSPTLKNMGKDMQSSLNIIETYNKALALTSPNAQNSASATLQFAQALGSGVMRGDEFNSMMENGRGVMQALADGLGLPLGALRALAEQGQLTADVVIAALESQADSVDQKFTKIPLTVSSATQVANNNIMVSIGHFDEMTDTTAHLASGIIFASEHIEEMAIVVGVGLTAAIATKAVPTLYSMVVATNAATFSGKRFIVTARAMAAAAMLFAKTPLGAAATAGATAIAYFALKSDDAVESAEELINRLELMKDGFEHLSTAQTRQALAEVEADMDKMRAKVFSNQDKSLMDVLFGDPDEARKEHETLWKAWTKLIEAKKQLKTKLDNPTALTPISILGIDAKKGDAELDYLLSIADAAKVALDKEYELKQQMALRNNQAKVWMAQEAQWRKDKFDLGFDDESLKQDDLLAQTLEMANATDLYGDAWTRTGNKALDAMGSMLNVMDKVGATDKKYADQMIVMRKAGLTQTEEFIALEKARAKNSIRGSMSMLDASVAMYEEGSAAQEAAHKASLVFHTVEMAMELQKLAQSISVSNAIITQKTAEATVGGTAAVINQGTGDPYTAIPRMLAMGAMVAGLLSQIGATFGGASGSSSASYAYVPDNGSGVLGGGDSNAWQNFNDRLMDVNAEQYNELRAINQNTKFLNQAMVSASSALYSTGTISGLSVDLSSFQKSDAVKLVESISDTVANIPVLGVFGDLFGGLVSNIAGAIFGGGTKRTSVGYGLKVGGALGDVGVGGYQTIKKKTDGGWFGKTKTSYYDINRAVDPQVGEAINSTFNYLGDTLVNFGDLLERDVSEFVGDLRVTTGKINLTGKSSAQVQEALTNAINVQSDKWAYELFGEVINQYQKIEESAFDTLSRLVIDKTVVEDVLKTTGQTVVGDALALSQSLISVAGSLESLTDSATTYYDAFYSDAEKQARLTEQLTGALAGVNLALPNARDGYRSLVESMDLSTDAGQQAYVTLLSLSDSADQYYTTLERQEDELNQIRLDGIQAQIDALDSLMNTIDQVYGSLVDSVVTTNPADYMQAQSVLSDALLTAKSGQMVSEEEIKASLNIVANNSVDNYSSLSAFEYDQLVTANILSQLNEALNANKIDINGSHYSGLSSVPYDGYIAETHKDEIIMDAQLSNGLKRYGIPVHQSGGNAIVLAEIKELLIKLNQTLIQNGITADAIATHTYNSVTKLGLIERFGISV